MNLRAEVQRAQPDFPWLDADDPGPVGRYLDRAGWLQSGETLRGCGRAGEGNMNLTLRIRTDRRSFILKQARPWVEKYPDIPAPWDRSRFEQAFYARIATIPEVASRMPALLGRDAEARVLLLEDLPGARDLGLLYDRDAGAVLGDDEVDQLAHYLAHLHAATEGDPDPDFSNRAMRALNHPHIYEIPLSKGSGVDLENLEPGLAEAARGLREDTAFRACVRETGERYLRDGRCLLHGDFFPGSWLRSECGLRVIDPEFGFFGDPEFDLGCAVAHLALAGQPLALARRLLARYARSSDAEWIARFAAAEVMRRLIGVAQLPIPPTTGARARLLAGARCAMLEQSFERLWE